MAPANQQINAAAAAAGGDNEEQQDPAPMNFMSIMNWILFFWIFQNLSGMITSKFVPPPPNAANMMPAAATGVEGNDVVVPQMKPLGANPMDKKSTAHDAKKVNRMMKPACLWQQGTMMDLDLIISDSPEVPAGWPSLTTKSDNDKEQVKKGTILASWTQQDLILGGRPHDPYAKAS